MRKYLLASIIVAFSLGGVSGALFERYYSAHKLLLQFGIRAIEFSDTTGRVRAHATLDKPLIIFIMGQSNVANTIAFADGRENLDSEVLNWYENRLYVAQDPLLGNTGRDASIWLSVADELRLLVPERPIILVPAARNNTSINDWLSGSFSNLPEKIQSQLSKEGLTPDIIVWGQGERDSMDAMPTDEYFSKLKQFRTHLMDLFPETPFVLSLTSRCFNTPINHSIRNAQLKMETLDYTVIGPDTDKLGPEYRFDGCHFADSARVILSRQWAESIVQALKGPQ